MCSLVQGRLGHSQWCRGVTGGAFWFCWQLVHDLTFSSNYLFMPAWPPHKTSGQANLSFLWFLDGPGGVLWSLWLVLLLVPQLYCLEHNHPVKLIGLSFVDKVAAVLWRCVSILVELLFALLTALGLYWSMLTFELHSLVTIGEYLVRILFLQVKVHCQVTLVVASNSKHLHLSSLSLAYIESCNCRSPEWEPNIGLELKLKLVLVYSQRRCAVGPGLVIWHYDE